MADQPVTINDLPAKTVLANDDIIVVGNTVNTYNMTTTVFRGQLYSNNSSVSFPVPGYYVGTAPAANAHANGNLIYVYDGSNGSPCYATSNGTSWLIVATLGGVISNT